MNEIDRQRLRDATQRAQTRQAPPPREPIDTSFRDAIAVVIARIPNRTNKAPRK